MAEKTMDDYIMVFSTCDSAEIALSISEILVSRQLAACVNIVKGIESVYQWQGKIEHSQEILLMIKTRQSLFSPLKLVIQELHDYELPEIIGMSL